MSEFEKELSQLSITQLWESFFHPEKAAWIEVYFLLLEELAPKKN